MNLCLTYFIATSHSPLRFFSANCRSTRRYFPCATVFDFFNVLIKNANNQTAIDASFAMSRSVLE